MATINIVLHTDSFGDLEPNSIIVWKKNKYTLKFGWHTNYSNQTIYSWYLEPIDNILQFETNTGYDSLSSGINSYIRTLYQDMINEISAVLYVD